MIFAYVLSLSHIRLCHPLGCSQPKGLPVHGILQARILEGVSMPCFSDIAYTWKLKKKDMNKLICKMKTNSQT